MKAATGVALLASAGIANAATLGGRAAASSEKLCAQGSADEGSNWYCQPVSQIVYTNVGASGGSYQEVVHMDPNTGACEKATKSIAGGLAPFDEPLSVHIRGPFNLIQMAVYTPGTKTKKRDASAAREQRHAHNHAQAHAKHARYQHAHLHDEREAPHKVEEKREHPTVWVTATINGEVVSWTNDYWGPTDTPDANTAAAAAAPAPPASTPAEVEAKPSPTTTVAVNGVNAGAYVAPAASSKPSSSAPVKPSSAPVTGDYVRTAYYNNGVSEGLSFLGNYGGVAGSGSWSPKFGNTLSYVDSTGTTGSATPQTLSNVTLHSNKELGIFTDQACDSSCGYVQPGSVANKGFAGADKTFLFEFQMPHESPVGFLADQPALWFLNAKIPYTQQYGDCSCWGTGCGEFDAFEVLANGDTKCKSTFHSTFKGGDSNYFARPADKPVKVAVVFDSASRSVSVKVLDDGVVFGESLTAEDVAGFMSDDSPSAAGVGTLGTSLFAIAS